MRKPNVQEVNFELSRLQNLIKHLQKSDAWQESFRTGTGYIPGGPETAAIRRASMDLTRALAKLRNDR
jgi:hypothetical protein